MELVGVPPNYLLYGGAGEGGAGEGGWRGGATPLSSSLSQTTSTAAATAAPLSQRLSQRLGGDPDHSLSGYTKAPAQPPKAARDAWADPV